MTIADADKYLNNDFKSVDGWCIPHLWNVIQPIHDLQDRMNIKKPIAEIGVFHGKFFIGLALTKNGHGKHHAFDVFDMQQFNLDGAGSGNLVAFSSNLRRSGLTDEHVSIIRADSMALTEKAVIDVRASTEGFSMFSVDGCHTVEHTINDFTIAMQMTCPEGVIFVDDYTNSDWPGVQEGMAKLYLSSSPRFVPLALTCNKLITCHISYHSTMFQTVKDFIVSKLPHVRIKVVKRFGYDCINVHPNYDSDIYCVL